MRHLRSMYLVYFGLVRLRLCTLWKRIKKCGSEYALDSVSQENKNQISRPFWNSTSIRSEQAHLFEAIGIQELIFKLFPLLLPDTHKQH